MVINSKSLWPFWFAEAQDWVERRIYIRGEIDILQIFLEFCHRQEKTIQCVGKARVFILVGGRGWRWLISFFQGTDVGGQSLREEARGREKRIRFMTFWIPAFMSCVLPFPILEVHDTPRNHCGTQSSDLHAEAELDSPAMALIQRHTQSYPGSGVLLPF